MTADTNPEARAAALDRLFHDLRGALNGAVLHVEVARLAGPGAAEGRARALEAASRQLERLSEAVDRLETLVLGAP